MLISFSVTNFRSIKETQTIYLSVDPKLSKKDKFKNNLFKTGLKSEPHLLKSAAIYGANASGKSNFIRALFVFNLVALNLNLKRGKDVAGFDPFILNEENKSKPTEFEIDFITQKTRYVYAFGFDRTKIHFEKLERFEGEEKKLIYEIKLDGEELKENFTELFEGKKDSIDAVKNNKNHLFLPSSVGLDGNKFLNPIYDWIEKKLFIANKPSHFQKTADWILENEENKRKTLELLKASDLGIADFSIKKQELHERFFEDEDFKSLPEKIKEDLKNHKEATFTNSGGYSLDFDDLSDGSKTLFNLSKPIFETLENGGVLFFDELDRSLQPDVLKNIVRIFHDPNLNKNKAQIVFNLHNDILLEKKEKILRHDQVWFASKVKDGATELYSLSEFEDVKKSDDIVKKYREYDFGARPFIKDLNY
jgi:AAA15 family ATPase/GTPase